MEFTLLHVVLFLQQISPGVVNTEIWDHGSKIYNTEFVRTMPVLEPEDIAGIVIFLLSRPMRVQVIFLNARYIVNCLYKICSENLLNTLLGCILSQTILLDSHYGDVVQCKMCS